MEARWLPYKFLWSPLPAAPNLDYHTAANWAKWNSTDSVWERSGQVPAAADDIGFLDGFIVPGENGGAPWNSNIGMTLSQAGGWDVHSVTIDPSYTAVITLQSDLVVSGIPFTASANSFPDSGVTMRSATIAGAGGRLVLDSGAKFEWSGGTLRDLTVLVKDQGEGRTQAEVLVKDTAAGAGPVMLSSGFDVEGKVWWESGSVNCDKSAADKPECAIHVRESGGFGIISGGTWGTDSNNLVVTNNGVVGVNTASTATINGSYTTLGWTRLLSGTFLVNGSAI